LEKDNLTTKAADKISFGESLGFGLGNFGAMFIWNTMTLFMVYFLTDVAGVVAGIAGAIIFFVRFVDAFVDPIIGFISDRTHTRWGQKRPFILLGAVPLAVFFGLCFMVPDLAPGGLYVYYFVVLLLMWIAYSLYNIPYNALLPTMTQDAGERSKLSGFYNIFTFIGIILTAVITKPVVAAFPTERAGWQAVGILFGVITMVSLLVTFWTVKERYEAETVSQYNAREIARLLWANKPFMQLTGAALCIFIAFTIMGALLNYMFKYYLHSESLFSVAMGIVFVTALIFVPVWVFIFNKIGKKAGYMLGLGIYAISLVSIYFIHTPVNMAVLVPIFIFGGIGNSSFQVGLWALIPDTVEYSQWKQGARTEGIQYGFYLFIGKLGCSIAALMVGAGLTLAKYVPNAVQTDATLYDIRLLGSFVPAFFIVIAMIILSFYPINAKVHKQIVEELSQRSAA
jgi:glycoside/pentoside/hexuronide:cation symporter, GPH family